MCRDYAISKTEVTSDEFVLVGNGAKKISKYDCAPSFTYESQKYVHDVGRTDFGWGITMSPFGELILMH